MKNIILLLVIVFVVKFGWAQNSNLDYKYAVKVYNLTSYEEYGKSTEHVNQTVSTMQILHPTIAFNWNNEKRNVHELELTHFNFANVETNSEALDTVKGGNFNVDYDVTSVAIAVQYEYILNFNKAKDTRFVPSLGFGFNPYYRQTNYNPSIKSKFKYSEIYVGSKLFVTPRLSYLIGSKFFVEINIPICISNIYFVSDKSENPIYENGEGTQSSFNLEVFPKIFSGRIGVGLRI